MSLWGGSWCFCFINGRYHLSFHIVYFLYNIRYNQIQRRNSSFQTDIVGSCVGYNHTEGQVICRMFEELFYERLTRLRSAKGVSARDMSLSIGQNAGYINALENKKGFPSMQVFFYICEYLGVTPSEFFDDSNGHPAEYREVLEDLNALDEEKFRNITVLIKGLKH